MQDMRLANNSAAGAAAATAATGAGAPAVPSGVGIWWPEQLTSLSLCVPGE
jgi:hypothetical protein